MRQIAPTHVLGLIGGLAVGSTIHYYKALTRGLAAEGCVPRIVIAHAHVPVVFAFIRQGDYEGLAAYLHQFIVDLAAAGATLVAVSAVTPHVCAPILSRLSPLPLIDLVEATDNALEAHGMRTIALIGTRIAMETGLFGRLRAVALVKPSADEVTTIHDCYIRIAAGGEDPRDIDTVRRIARRLFAHGHAEAIVVAGTDFSPLLSDNEPEFRVLDCSRIHVEAIIRRMLGAKIAGT